MSMHTDWHYDDNAYEVRKPERAFTLVMKLERAFILTTVRIRTVVSNEFTFKVNAYGLGL